MDAIDILGSLLGRKAGSGGSGADVLKDILGRAPRTGTRETRGSTTYTQSSGPMDLEQQARELEDLLNVATGRNRSPAQTPRQPQAPLQPQPRSEPQSPQFPPQFESPSASNRPQPMPDMRRQSPQFEQTSQRDSNFGRPFDTFPDQAQSAPQFQQPSAKDQNEEALVLVRAMVNAAKADGKLSQQEQQNIFQQIGDTSQETIQFLREEFARAADVREFAWSVPIGMEQKVYTISLIAIDLDTNAEANYLRELAHGLRLAPEICKQIHQRHGAPSIF